MDVCSALKTTKGFQSKSPGLSLLQLMKLVWNYPNINATSHMTTCKGEESHSKKLRVILYLFTDSVHKAFDRAAQSARTFACALIAFSDSPVFAVMLDATSASISLPPHVEEAMQAGVCLPEGRPGSEHANWRQDANFQVEQIAPEFRLTIYERILQWEKKLATIRGSCVACIFPDGYEGANKIGSGQIPIGDVIDGLVGKDTNDTQRTYCDIVDLVKDIPAALFGAVECPPEGEADLIIVGDSSFALVANHDNPRALFQALIW